MTLEFADELTSVEDHKILRKKKESRENSIRYKRFQG